MLTAGVGTGPGHDPRPVIGAGAELQRTSFLSFRSPGFPRYQGRGVPIPLHGNAGRTFTRLKRILSWPPKTSTRLQGGLASRTRPFARPWSPPPLVSGSLATPSSAKRAGGGSRISEPGACGFPATRWRSCSATAAWGAVTTQQGSTSGGASGHRGEGEGPTSGSSKTKQINGTPRSVPW
jgi:hypothetical protein